MRVAVDDVPGGVVGHLFEHLFASAAAPGRRDEGVARRVKREVRHAGLSVSTKFEGRVIRNVAGRVASEREVLGVVVGEDAFHGSAVGAECAMEVGCGAEDDERASSDGGIFGGVERVDGGVLDEDGAPERRERGVGEVDDDDLGCDEETA